MEAQKEKVMSKQVGGKHYKKKKFQVWDIVDEYDLNYYEGNAVKYILRDKENRIEDLQKAIHYLEKQIIDLLDECRTDIVGEVGDGLT